MKILCFGDSNTYGYNPNSFFGGCYIESSRWVNLLAQKSGWETVNDGANGRCIPRVEYEIIRLDATIKKHSPDLLVIMLGSNDLLQLCGVDEAVIRMESFITKLCFDRGRILLIAPPAMKPGEWVTEKDLPEKSQKLAAAYEDLSKRIGIRFADAGKWGIDISFDGVHFTAKGHETFAEKLYEILL